MGVKVPKRVADRLASGVRRFQKVLAQARARDVNESDTVTIVTDILAEIFGFDKYEEITSEQAIRGTFCDLAVKVDGSIRYLIEVKAVGLKLKEDHLRQAINYGANHGIPWVVLTNGAEWFVHKIRFERPVSSELVCAFDLLTTNPRRDEDKEKLFLLCRDGIKKAAIEEFHERGQLVNRFVVSAVLQSDDVLKVVRREIKRAAPGVDVTLEGVRSTLPDVLKREVFDGDEVVAAKRRIARAANRRLRKKTHSRSKHSPEG